MAGVAAPPNISSWQEMDRDKAGGFVRSQVEAAAEPVKAFCSSPKVAPQ